MEIRTRALGHLSAPRPHLVILYHCDLRVIYISQTSVKMNNLNFDTMFFGDIAIEQEESNDTKLSRNSWKNDGSNNESCRGAAEYSILPAITKETKFRNIINNRS